MKRKGKEEKEGKRGIRESGQRGKRRKNTLKEGERGKSFYFTLFKKKG